MKYYVVSDIHGFFTIFQSALDDAGYFADTQPHKLVILGDLFDGGSEAKALQSFLLGLMDWGEVILIKGNHEDQFVDTFSSGKAPPYSHHVANEIYDTALQLTGCNWIMAQLRCYDFAEKVKAAPFYRRIIPAMLDYYETDRFIFTHGWIPCIRMWDGSYRYNPAWRTASETEWKNARWINGMDAAQTAPVDGKTVICGHCYAAYGHSKYGSKAANQADSSPYFGDGVIAIDACTAISGKINVLVVEDNS